jgi:hypothetical protein
MLAVKFHERSNFGPAKVQQFPIEDNVGTGFQGNFEAAASVRNLRQGFRHNRGEQRPQSLGMNVREWTPQRVCKSTLQQKTRFAERIHQPVQLPSRHRHTPHQIGFEDKQLPETGPFHQCSLSLYRMTYITGIGQANQQVYGCQNKN